MTFYVSIRTTSSEYLEFAVTDRTEEQLVAELNDLKVPFLKFGLHTGTTWVNKINIVSVNIRKVG